MAASTRRESMAASASTDAESFDGRMNIRSVVLGDIEIVPQYTSLYREEVTGIDSMEYLYICPRCFKYTKDVVPFLAHVNFCKAKLGQFGSRIYSKDRFSIYEVDGAQEQLFAQNLSNFAKLFIENKSVCYDVHSFTYYVLVEVNDEQPEGQAIGFFSKEKLSWDNNNLACIVIFPPWQRRGLGQLLMAASYELGKKEGRLGGPERPLSELGKRSYLAYWSRTLAQYLLARPMNRSLPMSEISEALGMRAEDVLTTLAHMGITGDLRPDKKVSIPKQAVREWVAANEGNKPSSLDPKCFV